MPDSRPIGIFDSGVGGLTVFAAIARRLEGESTVYLGDTARVPYGTKSPETVRRYALACARLLGERDIKLLVVACNTASAFALEALSSALPVPVVGVVVPGATAAAHHTRTKRIGVIGTVGTIGSGAYQRAIAELLPDAEVFARPCPLFVPLAEEGWTDGDVPEQVARTYLQPLIQNGADTLVLGCTHYPLLKRTIGRVCGNGVRLVDSADETAAAAARMLEAHGLAAPEGNEAAHTFLVTDSPESFRDVGGRFVQQPLDAVEWVDF